MAGHSEAFLDSGLREPAKERLLVRSGGRVGSVAVESIDWAEAEGNYVRIHADAQVHVMRGTLSGLIDKIGPPRFFRIHRSRIVNIDRVKRLLIEGGGHYQVVMSDGTKLRLTRLYRDALRQRLARC